MFLLIVVDLVLTIFDCGTFVDALNELIEPDAVVFDTVLDVQGVVEVVLRILLSDVLPDIAFVGKTILHSLDHVKVEFELDVVTQDVT